MAKQIKLNASAVSRMGTASTVNECNFYMNGRYMHGQDMNNVQVTIENSGTDYLFAVSEGMDRKEQDENSYISVIKEIKKVDKKLKSSDEGIENKFDKLYECVEAANNIAYSILSSDVKETLKKPAFAAMLLNENKAAILNAGSCSVYLARGGMLRQLSMDYKKAERLLKMGIITDEQAEAISDRFGIPNDGRPVEVKKADILNIKQGDVFFMCTSGVMDLIDEDRLLQVLLTNKDTDYVAAKLVEQAVKNGAKDDLTVLVVRIDETSAEEKKEVTHKADASHRRTAPKHPVYNIKAVPKRHSTKSSRRKTNINKCISIVIVLLIIAGMFYGFVKFWLFFTKNSFSEDLPKQDSVNEIEEDSDFTDQDNTQFETDIDNEDEETEEENATEDDNTSHQTYEVQPGDTLYQISMKIYGDGNKYRDIMEANGIEDPNVIKVGQVLIIP